MGDWCKTQHGKVYTLPKRTTFHCNQLTLRPQSGLTEACLASPHARDIVRRAVLDYIKKWIPRRRDGVLAGNSVHADRAFLVQEMPEVVDWLHYRYVNFHNSSVSAQPTRGFDLMPAGSWVSSEIPHHPTLLIHLRRKRRFFSQG